MTKFIPINDNFKNFFKPSTTPISHLLIKTKKDKFLEYNTTLDRIEEQMIDDISYYDRDEVNRLSLISVDIGLNMTRIVGENVKHDIVPNFNGCDSCIFHNGKVVKFEKDEKKNYYCEFDYNSGRVRRTKLRLEDCNINKFRSCGSVIFGNINENGKDFIYSYDGKSSEINRLTKADHFYCYLTFAASSLVFEEYYREKNQTINRMVNGMQVKRDIKASGIVSGISSYSPISSTLLIDTRGWRSNKLLLFDIKRYNTLAQIDDKAAVGQSSAMIDLGGIPTPIITSQDKVVCIV